MSQTEIQIHDARSLANYRKGNLLVLLATAVVVFGGTKPLQAQTYTNVYWYPASLGGSGTWNSSNSFWSTNSAGSGTLVAPSSGTNYIYNFTGAAGTVTENSSFTVAGINWLTSGYVWTSGANRTLTGTDATATGTNTISITNNANLTIAGSGFTFDALSMTGGAAATLTLSNAAGATTTNIFGTSSGKGGRTNFVNTIVAGAGTNVLGTKSSAGFTQAGNITNNSAGMLVLTNSTNGTLSVSGAISGSGALTLANPSTGRIALNASNSYSGGTTVISTGGGQINLGDSAALGTGTVTIADAGTNYVRAAANSLNFANAFVINNGSTLRLGATNTSWKSTLSGTISGAGGIYYAVSDNGLSLTATNSSFGGGINIGSSGVLYVTSLGMAGGNSSIGTNETITLSSESGTSGASSVVWLGRSNEISDKTFALSAISTSPSQGVKIYAGDTSQGGTNVTLTLSGGITSTSTGNKVVTFGAYNTNTLIVNGLINQTAGYTNSVVIGVTGQNGTVVLGNTNNSFGAGVTINAGSSSTNIVQVAAIGSAGANSALGTNGTIHIGGSSSTGANILKYTGSGETSDKVINLAGTTGGATLDQSGTGNLKFTSAMTATGVGSKTLTLQGSTAGSGELSADLSNLGGNSISLVKNGSGTWMLSGNNTYNGATTVSAGTLQIGNGGTSGTLGTGSVANSGVLDFKRSDAYAVSNAISGAGSLVQSGGGTLTLSGANTYSGGTTVSAGSLAVGANDVLGSGAVTVNGGTLDLGNYSDTVGVVTLTSGAISGSGGTLTGSSYAVESGSVSAILGGAGALTKSTAGTATLSGANSFSGGTTVNAGTLAYGANNVLANGGAVNVSGGTLDIAGYSDTVGVVTLTSGAINGTGGTLTGSSYVLESGTVSAILGGSGTLTKNTAGTVTLSGNNSFSGNTALNAGTLVLNGANTGSSTVTINSSSRPTLKLGHTNALINSVLVGAGSSANTGNLELAVGGDFVVGSYGNSGTGGANMNFTNSSGSQASLTFTAATNVVTTGNNASRTIANNSTDLTLVFNGTVDISSSNTNDITFFTAGGTIIKGSVINTSTGIRGLVKSGAGILTLEGTNTYNGATTVSAGTLQIGNGGTSGTLGTGSVANSGVLDFKRSDAYAVSNAISGAGSLVQSGGGTLTLSGANTYSGGTTVSAGSLAVGANDVLGSGAVTVNGGTLDLGNYSDTVGVVTLTSGAISGSGGTLTGSSYAVESGSVSAILGGNGALTKSTAGMVTLSGNNTYSGLTTIRGAGGSLRMASTGALSTATALIGSSSSAETATLDLAAAGNYVAKSYGTTSSAGFNMNFTNSSGGAATLTFTNANNYVTHSSAGSGGRSLVNQSANLTVQFDGDIDIGSSVSDTVTFGGAGNFRINGSLTNGGNGVRALEKTGAGTLTLAGANNNYNGATTVKTGTLVIATGGAITSVASVSNAASMIIQSGASAGELSVSGMATVNGTAGSTIVNNGGTLKGTGTVSALTIASGGTLAVGNSPGQLNVAGNAEWAGGGIYSWELASALGNTTSPLAGQGTNWDFLNVTGILNITASSSPGNRFIIDIASLLPSGDTSFNPNENYSFAIATAAGGFTYGGSAGAFNSALFEITGYQANSGNWSLGVTGASGSSQSLLLAYAGATAIPEPSCSLLMGLGLVAILGLRSSRRKSA